MSEDPNNAWNNKTGSFIKRPGKGWLHPDEKLEKEEVVYHIKFIGMIPVNEPMKSLSFEMRTYVARESIRRVAEVAQASTFQRKNKKNDETLNRILSSKPEILGSGTDVSLHINIHTLRVNRFGNDESIFQHQMQNISFACGGDTDIQDYVAYVAKDEQKRACYVFQCPNNLANNVITTVGQAFELRFKKFLGSFPTNNNHNNNNNNNSFGGGRGYIDGSGSSNGGGYLDRRIPDRSGMNVPVPLSRHQFEEFGRSRNYNIEEEMASGFRSGSQKRSNGSIQREDLEPLNYRSSIKPRGPNTTMDRSFHEHREREFSNSAFSNSQFAGLPEIPLKDIA